MSYKPLILLQLRELEGASTSTVARSPRHPAGVPLHCCGGCYSTPAAARLAGAGGALPNLAMSRRRALSKPPPAAPQGRTARAPRAQRGDPRSPARSAGPGGRRGGRRRTGRKRFAFCTPAAARQTSAWGCSPPEGGSAQKRNLDGDAGASAFGRTKKGEKKTSCAGVRSSLPSSGGPSVRA